jgi:uncharacterized membrane protein
VVVEVEDFLEAVAVGDSPEAAGALVAEEPEGAGDMRSKDFQSQLRHDDIVAAIREAERQTSGEIRVFVSRKEVDDPVPAAQAAFVRLGMGKTKERNGVLIFVAPRVNRFAIIGDSAVHAKCGDSFWTEVRDCMAEHFRKSDFTHGIIFGIKKAGALLSQHFPCQPDDRNELPDDVAHD